MTRIVLFVLCCLCCNPVSCFAFKVVKDINSGKAPDEKVIIFEKGKPHDHLEVADSECAAFSWLADGSLQCRITGNKAISPTIKWKAGAPGIPAAFGAKDYSLLILRCKLAGSVKETLGGGKALERRPDNLWIGPSLLNAKGERVGGVSMADVTEDNKTPAEMTTLVVPMMLFADESTIDTSNITGVIFPWSAARPNVDRDFYLVIEKISLAN